MAIVASPARGGPDPTLVVKYSDPTTWKFKKKLSSIQACTMGQRGLSAGRKSSMRRYVSLF